MKIESKVCSPEQAIKLSELGITTSFYHEHCFKWTQHEQLPSGGVAYNTRDWHVVHTTYLDGFGHGGSYQAFDVAELALMCRDCISGPCSNRNTFYATPDENNPYDLDNAMDEQFGAGPWPDDLPYYCERETQARALADLLIWLLERGLLMAEEVNERLKNG